MKYFAYNLTATGKMSPAKYAEVPYRGWDKHRHFYVRELADDERSLSLSQLEARYPA